MPTLRCGVTIRSVGYSGLKDPGKEKTMLLCGIIDKLEALRLGGSVGAASPIYFMSASTT